LYGGLKCMSDNIEKLMLPYKVQQLLNTIIKKKGLGVEDAMYYLYSSELYRQLSSESSCLWQLSTFNLYDLIKKEKRLKKHHRNNSAPVLLFLTFCIENYKAYKNMNTEKTLFLFSKYNVLNYLEDTFDTLHTQGKEYIMREIDSYINNK
jgi:hypothetical protein